MDKNKSQVIALICGIENKEPHMNNQTHKYNGGEVRWEEEEQGKGDGRSLFFGW